VPAAFSLNFCQIRSTKNESLLRQNKGFILHIFLIYVLYFHFCLLPPRELRRENLNIIVSSTSSSGKYLFYLHFSIFRIPHKGHGEFRVCVGWKINKKKEN
jgi:hypothetical protein